MDNNPTTRRYPRTLEEAFGPYQRHGLITQYDPMPSADRIVVGTGCVALVVILIMAAAGWL